MVGIGRTGILPTACIVLVQQARGYLGGASNRSPWHVCLVQSKVDDEEGAKLLYLSIPRKLKMRQRIMAGPKESKQQKRLHSWMKKCGKIGRR